MSNANTSASVKPNAGKNYLNQATQRIGGLSVAYKVVFAIFLIIIIGFLIYWGISSRSSSTLNVRMNPVIISEPINAFNSTAGQHPVTLPVSNQGMDFTYSSWLYVADWSFNYGKRKYIFVKSSSLTDQNRWAPAIWLNETMNTLSTSMAIYPKQTNPFDNETTLRAPQFETCMVTDIPLQKWVHLAYILNNRNVDIYINGKLEKSCFLNGVPDLNGGPLHILPTMPTEPGEAKSPSGFFGQLTLQYFSRALEPNEVSDIYQRGPYSN